MVSSALGNFEARLVLVFIFLEIQNLKSPISRQNIRETWGNVTEFNYPMFWKFHSKLQGKFLDLKKEDIEKYKEYLNVSNHHYAF